MWLVNAALRHPYAVWVGMMLTMVVGLLSYLQTPTDILPPIKSPVVVVFASYRGMPAPDMEQSVVSVLERALTRCDYLDHLESRSLLGIGIIRVCFRPEVNPDVAANQVLSLVQTVMQDMPPGMLQPSVIKYDAAAVPVGALLVSSDDPERDDKFLLDLADRGMRDDLAGIEGLASAPVFGGVPRQVQIYVHPRRLEALKLSLTDISERVNRQTLVMPTGEIRIGNQDFYVTSNSMMPTPEDFANIPLWNDGRRVVHLGDVADIRDGQRWRTNTVRVQGERAVYMPLFRQSGASAVAVVDNVQKFLHEDLPKRDTIPEDVKVEVAFDQSQYVRDAMANLRTEGILGAVLASLVVLLFLGSIRSTWIVALSIPLSVMAAFAGLYYMGYTLNIMTLGGLALVLGRLIDDSIIDVENTVRHLEMGKTPLEAARDSAQEIAVPVLLATVTTVIVFFPLTFMSGMGRDLFTPLAVAATLAMIASYVVSRTVSPLYCARVLRPHHEGERFPWRMIKWALIVAVVCLLPSLLELVPQWLPFSGKGLQLSRAVRSTVGFTATGIVLLAPLIGFLFWVAPRFDRAYERFAGVYERGITAIVRRPVFTLLVVGALIIPTIWAYGRVGQELFPEVDTSEFTIHLRAPGGPRVEETEQQCAVIENMLRGYKASYRDFVQEMIYLTESHDEEFLELTEEKNAPADRETVRRIIAAAEAEDQDTLDQIISEHETDFLIIPPLIAPEDQSLILTNVGVNARWSAIYTPNNGPHAAFVRVQLRSGFEGRHTPVRSYLRRLRGRLHNRFPGHDFFFETGGMIRQILNAGAVAPVQIEVMGRDHVVRRQVARDIEAKILEARKTTLPQVQDTYLPQAMDLPQLKIVVDRDKAQLLGYTQTDILRNVITALMSSAQLAPNFWIEPSTGNPYIIGVQYPEYQVVDLQTLENVPISATRSGGRVAERGPGPTVRLLKDVATIQRTQGPVEIYHNESTRVSQLFVSIRGNDLARAAAEIERICQAQELPKGVRVRVLGEVSSMRKSFAAMAFTLVFAVILVYLVMVVQFRSFVDPAIMLVTAPLGLIGVIAILWLTRTSFNIQSAMGVLMMIGISQSNGVLIVDFANRKMEEGLDSFHAVVGAARTRLRPIIMTTVATIIGLLPMAVHRHPGDEMNLPLARAVIGGLTGSTLLVLFVIPALYVLVRPNRTERPADAV
jgi:multidrug efflux pump subunit AcrB